ncbi:hypothetical protein WG947_13860 [Pontibacter sp. H259]|uniref:hypothetical protein n=1 Tax=Pontibacter sp. H259 TaxID=3133421 RepID=UPI0030C26FFF
MLIKLFTVYVYLQAVICGCGPDKRNSNFERLKKDYQVSIDQIGRLDARISESSGLARASDSTFLTHADGGTLNELYLFNLKGQWLQTIPLPLPNTDWEELTQDKKGNLFIGNFGNNGNLRRDLTIYKLAEKDLSIKDTLAFSFADQQEFPPPRRRQHYDLEAFFYHTDSLYLFSKSRALRSITKLYKLPVSGAISALEPLQQLQVKSPVTAADIAPDTSTFALLGYGRLYLFKRADATLNFNGKRYCLPLGRTGQAEAILYLSPQQLLISNENGKLYLITLRPKK